MTRGIGVATEGRSGRLLAAVTGSFARVPAGATARGWPWLLAAVGALGLLLPWLLSPIATDDRYHFVAAPHRMDGNLLRVVPFTLNDLQWRLRSGRLDPFADGGRQVVYLLAMQFAHATGAPLFVVHGMLKLLLLAAVVGSYWLLLRQLRRADGDRLSSTTCRIAVLLLGVGTVLGVTTVTPGRNGWTAFVVLCIGGVAYMFLVAAVALWVRNRWSSWGRAGRTAGVLGLAMLGSIVVLSYELHWAAVAFAAVLAAFSGRTPWRAFRPRPGDGARVAVVGGLLTGFLVTLVWTRWLIAAKVTDRYAGIDVDLGLAVLRTTALQLVNSVPGVGIPRTLHDLTPGQATPIPFGGTGWLWGLALAGGLALLLRRAELPGPSVRDADGPALRSLGAALAVSAVTADLIVSVSRQSHQIVRYPGDTYRATPWIWVCLVGMAVVVLLARRSASPVGRRAIVALPVAGALLAGIVVWPYTVAAVQTQRQAADTQIWEAAQAEVVTGSADPVAVAHRCLLSRQATAWAGTSGYRKAYLPLYEESFEYQWHRPWCPAPAPRTP